MQSGYDWMYSQEVLQDKNRIGKSSNMMVTPTYQVNYTTPIHAIPPPESGNYQQPILTSMQEVQDQYMQKEIENKQKKEVKPIEPVTENKVENENKVDSTTSNVKEEESKEEDKKEEDKKEIIEETEKSEDRKRPHSHFILQTSEDEKDQEEDENRYIDPETGEKWIRCQNPFCGKWRFVPDEVEMPTQNPWFCILNNWDEGTASCSYPQLTEGYIVVKKKEEPEKEWMPKRECHFEKITPLTY